MAVSNKMTNKKKIHPISKLIFISILILALLSLGFGLFKVGYAAGINEGKRLGYDEIVLNIKQWDTGFYEQGIFFNPSSEGLDIIVEDSKGEFVRLNDDGSWYPSWFRVINDTYLNSTILGS